MDYEKMWRKLRLKLTAAANISKSIPRYKFTLDNAIEEMDIIEENEKGE